MPLDPPALDSLIINGTKYAAADLFGKTFEAELEFGLDDPMVSSKNPIEVTAKIGVVDTITYTGDDTECTIVIEMSNGDQTAQYTLNIKQKPSAKLTYYDIDGTTVLGESRREIGKTIDHFDISFDAVQSEQRVDCVYRRTRIQISDSGSPGKHFDSAEFWLRGKLGYLGA